MQYLQSITTSIMPRMSYVKKITNDGATSPKNDAFASAATDKDDAIDADNNMAPGALLMTTDESNRSAEFIDDSNRSGDVEKSISNESPTEKSHRTNTLNNKDVTTTNNPATMEDGLLRHQQPAGGEHHSSSYSSSSQQQQQQYERIAQRLLEKESRASVGPFSHPGRGGDKQSFLHALHDIIEVHSSSSSSDENPIISWLPEGQGFIINDKQSFEQNILPSFLPNTKYASFTRRLKRWKFVRYVFFLTFMYSFHEHDIICAFDRGGACA